MWVPFPWSAISGPFRYLTQPGVCTRRIVQGEFQHLDPNFRRTHAFVAVWWCGGVFVVVFLWWCFCGGVFCGGVFVVLVWWCFCGGVFVAVFFVVVFL